MSHCLYVLCKLPADTRLLWPDLRASDYCLDHARAVWRAVEARSQKPVGFAVALLDHSGDVLAGPVVLEVPDPVPTQGVLL